MLPKPEWRARLKATRADIADRADKQAKILTALIRAVAPFDTVFTYVSMGTEADTRAFITRTDKRILVPHTAAGAMTARLYTGGSLDTDSMGNIPGTSLYAGPVSCTVVPLLGFNAELFRIGYGGGYYDRFLCAHDTFSVGIGFDEGLCDFAPDPFDVPLDMIITPERVLRRL